MVWQTWQKRKKKGDRLIYCNVFKVCHWWGGFQFSKCCHVRGRALWSFHSMPCDDVADLSDIGLTIGTHYLMTKYIRWTGILVPLSCIQAMDGVVPTSPSLFLLYLVLQVIILLQGKKENWGGGGSWKRKREWNWYTWHSFFLLTLATRFELIHGFGPDSIIVTRMR